MTDHSPKANLPNPILTYMEQSEKLKATILIEIMLPSKKVKKEFAESAYTVPEDTHLAIVSLGREGTIFASFTMSVGIDEFKDQLLKGSIMEEIEPIIEEHLNDLEGTPVKLVSTPPKGLQ